MVNPLPLPPPLLVVGPLVEDLFCDFPKQADELEWLSLYEQLAQWKLMSYIQYFSLVSLRMDQLFSFISGIRPDRMNDLPDISGQIKPLY